MVYDGLFGEHRTRDPSKLLQLSAEFLFLQIKNCPSSAQQSLSPIYFSTIKKLLNDDEVGLFLSWLSWLLENHLICLKIFASLINSINYLFF